MKLVTTLIIARRSPLLQVVKTSVAAVIAWVVASLALQQPLPIFAAIAALLVVQPSVTQSIEKGIERSIGVVAGVVIALGAGQLFGDQSWVILSVIIISVLVAWALRLSAGSANQIPISAMLVLALGGQNAGYAVERIVETIIGALIGLIVNLAIVAPVFVSPARVAVASLTKKTATVLESLARALTTPQSDAELRKLLDDARLLRDLRDAASTALRQGANSLTLNPRRSKHHRMLRRETELFDILTVLVTRTLGMARAIHDRYDTNLMDDPVVISIARELERAAHDLRLRGRAPDERESERPTRELLTLTAPLTVLTPHPQHWILIGSLLEDARRVHEVIVGDSDNG
ncbi:FUSC family protein [Salinibacterium sp. PAMC 21357]|uniref:FUSC family protein n=1 Tax=Salinibacterium sp. PAMC 21357 TaxID=1112215 RepID=UPI0002881AAA|nr:FUSC family protein [Salinibacterium sp. PAMC 21357]